jgi:uric acid-xanthine permease
MYRLDQLSDFVQDYMFLITPNLPFMRKRDRRAPFYGLNSDLPILLAVILGFVLLL